jgi:hypothetical protein
MENDVLPRYEIVNACSVTLAKEALKILGAA